MLNTLTTHTSHCPLRVLAVFTLGFQSYLHTQSTAFVWEGTLVRFTDVNDSIAEDHYNIVRYTSSEQGDEFDTGRT